MFQDRGRAPLSLRITAGVLLLALNLAIAGRLFFIEYLQYVGSIEPMFFAIARTIRERWPESGWWSQSNFGYPFAYAYQPLFHHLVAACAALTGLTEARAYHVMTGVFYVLGPISLYALMLRLTRAVWVSFTAALMYSLVSPSALLIPNVLADAGWQIRRLHVAVVYGEGPNVAGLALLPLAILFLDWARERRTWSAWLVASTVLISVPLTNIPAALALGMALVAYGLACGSPRVWLQIGVTCAAGFLLFAPWIEPSGLMLAFRNTQLWMDPAGRFAMAKLPYYLGIAALETIALFLFRRANLAQRFAVLFATICAPLPLLKAWAGVSLISEADRFHVAMEIPIAMGVTLAVCGLLGRVWILPLGAFGGGLLTLLAMQTAHRWIQPASLENRPEALISSWMNEHAGTDRVFVDGSTSFWFNHLSRVPQVRGCCSQNLLIPVMPHVHYAIHNQDGRGAADTIAGWLQVFGVHYVAFNGPKSLDVYPRVHHLPDLGVLQERWRNGDDMIYEVPLASPSLAHAVRREELVTREPANGIDVGPIAAYRAAVLDSSRPQAAFHFTSPSDAVVEGSLPRGFLYSVQIAYHDGWHASSTAGESVSIGKDALGFMTLAPDCDGACEVSLHFDGGREVIVLWVLCAVGWLGVGFMLWRERRIKVGIP